MRSIYIYARKEHPYAAEDDRIVNAADDMLSTVDELRKKDHYIKQIMSKKSLTVEQKLTYIASILYEGEGSFETFGTHDYSKDAVFNAIWNDHVEAIDSIK